MNKCVTAAVLVGGLLAAGAAFAEQVDAKAGLFDRLDSNQDGVISQQEMNGVKQALAQNGFDRVDTNRDGRISRQEYLNKARRDAAAAFKRMDGDGDQALSVVEATRLNASDMKTSARDRTSSPMADQVMNRMDSNDDGQVSPAEWSSAIKHNAALRSASVTQAGHPKS